MKLNYSFEKDPTTLLEVVEIIKWDVLIRWISHC